MVSIVRQILAMVIAFAGGLSSFISGLMLLHAHGTLGRGGDLRVAVLAGLGVQVGAAAYAFSHTRKPARVPARLRAHIPLGDRKG
jgi:hypothetical protein